MTDKFGSSRWWIGAEFGGSPKVLLNLASRFGVIPVFHTHKLIEGAEDFLHSVAAYLQKRYTE